MVTSDAPEDLQKGDRVLSMQLSDKDMARKENISAYEVSCSPRQEQQH